MRPAAGSVPSSLARGQGLAAQANASQRPFDLLCFSHLRWDSVFQRPQHLMSRCARAHRVYYVEEPVHGAGEPRLELRPTPEGPVVVVPHLPSGLDEAQVTPAQRRLLDGLLEDEGIGDLVAWYYTPMALPLSRHLEPMAVVYDCMDELSNFRFAPTQLPRLEAELFARADVVFTGGESLYESKRTRHHNAHLFPSSIDPAHFGAARGPLPDPADQAGLPRPRLGFYGVIDERLDIDLVAGIADAEPGWQLVMLGPVVKIDPADLPRRENVHYLGRKRYSELPSYLANWDAALLPFALNEATCFISPTKTLEYLAAAKPVISTSIRDVVRPYGDRGLVRIADGVDAFVAAARAALSEDDRSTWVADVDAMLARTCWDETWGRMLGHIGDVLAPAPRASASSD